MKMDIAPEGRTYAERYKVYDFPHIGIIDPRTRRLMWKKEGWTQENPMTAEVFAEIAMDFCSRHSLDKPPVAPRPPGAAAKKRPMHEMSEDEQLQAAMKASLQDGNTNDDKEIEIDNSDEEDDIEVVDSRDASGDSKPAAVSSEEANNVPSLMTELLAMALPEEPESGGARIQFRMPDGKRQVRKFSPADTVKQIYAFVAVC
jgi:UBX domain-containing protein 7